MVIRPLCKLGIFHGLPRSMDHERRTPYYYNITNASSLTKIQHMVLDESFSRTRSIFRSILPSKKQRYTMLAISAKSTTKIHSKKEEKEMNRFVLFQRLIGAWGTTGKLF